MDGWTNKRDERDPRDQGTNRQVDEQTTRLGSELPYGSVFVSSPSSFRRLRRFGPFGPFGPFGLKKNILIPRREGFPSIHLHRKMDGWTAPTIKKNSGHRNVRYYFQECVNYSLTTSTTSTASAAGASTTSTTASGVSSTALG